MLLGFGRLMPSGAKCRTRDAQLLNRYSLGVTDAGASDGNCQDSAMALGVYSRCLQQVSEPKAAQHTEAMAATGIISFIAP